MILYKYIAFKHLRQTLFQKNWRSGPPVISMTPLNY